MMLNSRQPMFMFWGPDLTMFYNDAYAPFLAERHGRALGQPFKEIWSDVWESVRPDVVSALSGNGTWTEDMRLVMSRNAVETETFWTFSYNPLFDDVGQLAGMINIAVDTTLAVYGRAEQERMTSDTQQQLDHQLRIERQRRVVQREMAHRIKNILSMTMAVVSQSMRHAENLQDAQATITQRIAALAKAQDILTNTDADNADVRAVIRQVLEPDQDHEDRIVLHGGGLSVPAQQALGLALVIHELATNAAKYGALSNDTGTVAITWAEDTDNVFVFEWLESGGPPVRPPTRSGFGSRLTSRIVGGYSNGRGDTSYHPDGVHYVLSGRIDRLSSEQNASSELYR